MGYALQTLWHEWSRYFAGILAVMFSAVLIALQCGLLLGLFKITSIPVDHTHADLWIGSKEVPSVDLGRPIPESHLGRVAGLEGVIAVERYVANFGNFSKPEGGTELCFMLGCQLDSQSIGVADVLTQEQRVALTEPFTIIVDESDVKRLHLDLNTAVKPKINGQEVKVVGTVKGLKSLAAPWVLCSHYTSKELLKFLIPGDDITYLLARTDTPERSKILAAELTKQYGEDMSAYTAEDFSFRSRKYWLTRTKAGLAICYAAALGLLVGMVITYQTLYAATIASAKEFAILLALGIPRWRISMMVLMQSIWVGIIGIAAAYPFCLGLKALAAQFNTEVDLRWEVVAGTAAITMTMAVLSGFIALRSVRQIEPMTLLR